MSTIERALSKQKKNQKVAPESSSTEPVDSVEQADETATTSAPVVKETSTPAVEQSDNSHKKELYIDVEDLEERGFVSIDASRRRINEEYRAIKRKLLKNAFGPLAETLTNPNIIMVSSAKPGEGKTFTAINLALSIAAEKDKTVLLVDADVLRPNVSKTLKIKTDDGLMEYLLDEKEDISEVMYNTNIDKLRIIPAGKSHHLSTELLASGKMQDTIDEIANRYPDRIVIIDTPPLIGINETAILTNFAGQAVVVTVEGRSKMVDIRNAVGQLNPDMAIGFIVNKAQLSVDDEAGYYGYYYASKD
ncbi:XrtA-associated tyrosine autokinase [Alteromonas sp. ASW11-36]|uniref:XrtA-associated tyrosine autokinase n=1 Tax=Alteromonas arenosi TaxID=3055817 RepID=A0ABT7SVP4_9ALTE|nr:XrtA-associated tyrosine autokinase [Alteromonas sp. ASW11-36]MDM7859619.1 XrtA-associated tyrosine autokinase [Alteromonas sp. ASW11-36]